MWSKKLANHYYVGHIVSQVLFSVVLSVYTSNTVIFCFIYVMNGVLLYFFIKAVLE